MPGQGPQPWLRFGGVEVANAGRVLSYLQNGLGATPHWELSGDTLCTSLYRNPDTCAVLTFTSPAADPAPWYDAAEPGAATFLGVVLLDLHGYDSINTRTINQRLSGLGGGVWTQQRRTFRRWQFQAALISSDDAGAEYGLRWLTSVLEASACDDCSTAALDVRLVCPTNPCDTLGRWTSYDAALVSGPTETEQWSPGFESMRGILAGCRTFTIVEFEIDAGNPFLYKPSVNALASTLVSSSAVCNELDAYPAGFYPGSLPPGGNLFVATMPDDAWTAQVQARSPVLWYRMDATAGVTEDDLGSANHDGTYHNFPTLNQPGATPNSPAVLFQKSANQYLGGLDDPAYSLVTTGALTVGWWAKSTVVATTAEEMVTKWTAAGNQREWLGERYATGGAEFRVFSLASGTFLANPSFGFPSLGEFHFYVATMKNNAGTVTIKTYLDAVLVDTKTFAFASVGDGTAPVEVGAREGAGFPFNGTLDEVMIFSTELSQADISALYSSVQPPLCVTVTPPTRNNQTLSAIFTFESTSGIGAVAMNAYSDCPRSGLETPELTLELGHVPPNSTVVVDSAQHTVTVTQTDPATGAITVYDGQSLLLPTGDATIDPVQWIEIASCDDITCICVSALDPCTYTGDTFVSIDTQLREG